MNNNRMPLVMIPISPTERKGNDIVFSNLNWLEPLASRIVYDQRFGNDAFVIACVMVDSGWCEIIDTLVPNIDWQLLADSDRESVIMGILPFKVCGFLAREFPEHANTLTERPVDGKARCIVLDQDDCVVYWLEPSRIQ